VSVLAGLLLSIGGAARAEEATASPSPRPTAHLLAARMVADLTEPLGLTEPQAAALRSALEADWLRRAEILAGRATGSVSQDALRALRDEIDVSQRQTRAELEPVLSAEQLARFDALQEQRREQAGGELIVLRLEDRLALTPEQRERLVPIFAADLHERRQLVEQSRGGGGFGSLRAMRARANAMQAELEKKLVPLLSEEQMKAYRQYRDQTRQQLKQRVSGPSGRRGTTPR
jgi:hypothetical protein